jgi:HAD superfamily hydrolase (TIGR01509 family)
VTLPEWVPSSLGGALRRAVQPIQAVLFDADGVIQNWTGDALAVRVKRILGFLPDPFEAFLQEIVAAEQPAIAGQADLLQSLEPVLSKWGAAGTAAELAPAWWYAVDADPAVLALIGKLRQQGIFCALATNQHRLRADYMRQALAYDSVFDRSFYSCELSCAKPDVRYFQAILASLPFAPEQVLFIDDLAKNVAAARSVGIEAAQFIHPKSPQGAPALRALLETFSVLVSE